MSFTDSFRACMTVLEEYKELQRVMAGINIAPRKRLLLRVIDAWQQQRSQQWMPLAEVVTNYNSASLQRLRVGESTIGEELKRMAKDDLVLRQRDPDNQRVMQIAIGPAGRDVLDQEKTLEKQRLDLYESLLLPEQKAVLEEFFVQVNREFSRQIRNWKNRFNGKMEV